MASVSDDPRTDPSDDVPPEAVAADAQHNPVARAAIIGGAIAAAAAGTYLGRRAMARRNSKDGKVSSVMAAAITACDLAKSRDQEPNAKDIVITPARGKPTGS